MDNITTMIQALPVREATKARMQESLEVMASARDRARCSQMRFELQGMINTLETEGLISIQELDAMGAAFGRLWRTLSQGFVIAALQATGGTDNDTRNQREGQEVI
ncbi:hypothetical protein IBG34_23205 (plasmid) [Aeromonas media]|uniref:Uncharacterized protein n=1 Tax=Aeromonas caviae TaxID=648 RepID=A0A7D5UKM9_AERCA|nr:hypothetical protein [Aeromonas caviae]QLI60464.1 hypothetical protein C1C91_23580 [Aeromonas caviae]QYK83505.1 hypothetical protein IBG34_23205 [Aeromonas media]